MCDKIICMKDAKMTISTGTFVRFWLVILGFAAAIALAWKAQTALMIILIAFFLALVLNRPVSWLARHLPGRSRVFATLIAYLLILLVIGLVFFNVVPVFVKQISSFLDSLPATLSALQDRSNLLGEFLDKYHLTSQYDAWLADMQKNLGAVAADIGGSFVDVISGLVSALVNVLFIAVLTFLMLVEGPIWEEKFWRLIYKDKTKRQRHQQLARKMYDVVGGYVSGQMTVAAISATLTAFAVAILSQIFRFDMSLMWTAWLAIFVMTFVPMFGAAIGGGIVALLLLLYAWPAAVIYLIFFVIEQQIENNFINPHIQSKRLNMSALLVLISVLIGLNLAGILGALVAIPVAGCIMVLLRDVLHRRRVRLAAEHGEKIDPDNDEGDMSIVFAGEERKRSFQFWRSKKKQKK